LYFKVNALILIAHDLYLFQQIQDNNILCQEIPSENYSPSPLLVKVMVRPWAVLLMVAPLVCLLAKKICSMISIAAAQVRPNIPPSDESPIRLKFYLEYLREKQLAHPSVY